MKKTAKLRNIIFSDELEFIMEAHNGISARIVEEAGFKGIWGSGLSLSAQYGVRDNNEASWTQVLDMLEFMSDATSIPILLDGDTGYGNFNNMRRLVGKLERLDIAGVCIEDKVFPKTNSFIKGYSQPLANIDEFSGKIKAGKDAQRDDDFIIIARVEAFIAGWGLKEALIRASAYHEAGADAILIHSALDAPDEILSFKSHWGDRCPVVIVPTKYYLTPTEVFINNNFSTVIWANHILRASASAMQKAAATIMSEKSLKPIESKIISVAEVFRLQGADELKQAEKNYLPKDKEITRSIILAASRGKLLADLTSDVPKAMIDISGKPLIGHIVESYNYLKINDITIVRGYKKETINLPNVKYVDNIDYSNSSEVESLRLALNSFNNDKETIISYGDILFEHSILSKVMSGDDDFVVAVDVNWRDSVNINRLADWVKASNPQSIKSFNRNVYLFEISNQLTEPNIHGEWAGLLKTSKRGFPILKKITNEFSEIKERNKKIIPFLINHMIKSGYRFKVIYITGGWLDVDSPEDVEIACNSFNDEGFSDSRIERVAL